MTVVARVAMIANLRSKAKGAGFALQDDFEFFDIRRTNHAVTIFVTGIELKLW